jgi:hypothetical protein
MIKKILTYSNKEYLNLLFYNNIINYYNKIFLFNIKCNLNIFYNKIKENSTNKAIMFSVLKNKIGKIKNLTLNLFKIKSYSFSNNFLFKKRKMNLLSNYVKNIIDNFSIKIYKKNLLNLDKFFLLYKFIKTGIQKKMKFLFNKSGLRLNKVNFLYYKKNITKTLIKLMKMLKSKKKNIYKYFLKTIKKYLLSEKKIKYKKIFSMKKENLIYKLKIRRFNTYPKTFIRMIEKYRYLSHRITVVRNKALNNNTFL